MHPINTPGAVGDEFQEGNPQTGQMATRLGSQWPNTIQRELLKLLTEAGIEPDADDDHQVFRALQVIIDNRIAANYVETHIISATSGYRLYADGWIEQWTQGATLGSGEAPETIEFPIEFPTACVSVIVSTNLVASGVGSDIDYQLVGSPSTESVTVQRQLFAGGGDDIDSFARIWARGH